MNYNKYDEVINGKNTYKEIAKLLQENDTIKDGAYIQDKLRFNNDCGDKLAELINGIISELVGAKDE